MTPHRLDLSVLSERPAYAEMPRRRVLRAYLEEARGEVLRYLRSPGFLLPTILFPVVFYVMFGILMGGKRGGLDIAAYLLASYTSFGVMAPGLFGFGVSLALERDNGLLVLKRALPMPPAAYLLGKMAMAMVVAAAIVSLLLLLATQAAGVVLSAAQVARLFAVGVLGVLPFSAMGLLLGTLVRGQGAPALINMLYLPMAFLSGLWPSYHLNQLAQDAVGMPSRGATVAHVLALGGFALGFLLLAARRLRRHG
jgi:ABC-2 type transport system permease protein